MNPPRGYLVCALEGCDEIFKKHGRQAYHHKDCRKAAQKAEEQRVYEYERKMYEKTKALAKLETGSAKRIGVDPKYLNRGKINYTGYTTL